MQIKKRLTYQFISIFSVIMLISSLSIYFFSSNYRRDDFHSRLKNKAENVAKILIDIDEINADLLKKIETNNPVNLPYEKISVFDYRNRLIYDSDTSVKYAINSDILNKVRIRKNMRLDNEEYEGLGFLFTGKYDRFVVIASAKDIYGIKRLKNLRLILITVFFSSIAVIYIAGKIFSDKALQPISRIIKQVDEISVSNLSYRVDEGINEDEIAQLARTFNKMLDRLEIAFKMQKNFIANASHELRTPLSVITGQIEVILMRDRTVSDYKNRLNQVLEEMHSLNHISNRLLLLAQTDSGFSTSDFRNFRIDEVIWQAKYELNKRYPDFKIFVGFEKPDIDESSFIIKGSEQLIKIAIINIMDNGCKYSADKTVHVTLLPRKDNILLRFLDRGVGIDESDINHLFEPFFRGKNSQNIKGHGVGLSLVKKIIDLNNGEIHIVTKKGKGTILTLKFKV